MFLYSLLKSAANAVLKLMSAVIAIAHVLFVSMKPLSVKIMLPDYSCGKLKHDSTILPMSGLLGSSTIFASKSQVSLAILNFFSLSSFQCGQVLPPFPGQKNPSTSPSIAYRILSRGWKKE